MWKKALTTVPKVSPEEWKQLDIITKWLIASRSAVFIMTVISSSIAGILAYRDGLFDLTIFILVTIGLVLAHATNNLLNDLVDWTKGVDQKDYVRAKYGSHPMTLMSRNELIMYIVVTGIMAMSIGVYLCMLRGIGVVYLTLLGSFFVLFYTWPLKYYAMGELAVLIVWGSLMIGGGYYTITNQWSWDVVLASFPYSLGVTTVIFGKHIDKFAADREKGIYTLPVLLGEYLAQRTIILMMIMQYLIVIYLVYSKFFGATVLIMLIGFFDDIRLKIFQALLTPKPKERPAEIPTNIWPLYFAPIAFLHNRTSGSLFLLGLVIDSVLHAK